MTWSANTRRTLVIVATVALLAAVGLTLVSLLARGGTWTAQQSGVGKNLHSVAFADATHGWAVGDLGTILRTTDGGAHWTVLNSGTGSNRQSVAFPDTTHGWAVDQDGGIVHTTDGGTHWTPQQSHNAYMLTSVAFIDAEHGWAVGFHRLILTTTDGGAHWTSQASRYRSFLWSVAFADANNGWAVGDDGVVLTTKNGGVHWWTQREAGPSERLFSVAFPRSGTVARRPRQGWAVGASGLEPQGVFGGYRLNAGYDTVLKTADAGAHWIPQTPGVVNWLHSVAFADPTHGWAVGEDGAILTTTNSGADWSPQTSGTHDALYSVAFTDADHGWAVGQAGTILVYRAGPAISRYAWIGVALLALVSLAALGLARRIGRAATPRKSEA